ncbi:MAG: hypothetical protein UV61_C0002G0084 [Candidatus Gottesmanbacteria bacterium GW2011_GWB1_43_11]|uniref:Uncharacterized protein n=1 Tax=Candidatus Gottesmanbacteria bacterium GW2011_GWB1_43_11 TaxID=1618446 RepID=A0A0G1FKE8_9BACT|nr:MAG: hypothetical protein UV04_C0040G0004 [Candidatus Gottesmanbacteria bacterium GW2011_GWA2_42_16]KKS52104.1 MAG: hypothetical protein UV17_C0051G0009 [Candidatus Gottesmanbacteria bacterium GW2011_GWA1_42_26]KKS81830.1 MAG: hypothetical protein UV55_C0008G0045 [Candidatus Gottesmanbacteria bacterium GW2011_GWC1_43_10]KKS87363.1 MAG: hypothetical protein UV61_C0002G0084 [Candidatus Gottesmanbacteria bacterium GW2011_GWB1_43_11]OGG10023.1 MAG: hypothetical protein A2699_06485 [Candidatus Go
MYIVAYINMNRVVLGLVVLLLLGALIVYATRKLVKVNLKDFTPKTSQSQSAKTSPTPTPIASPVASPWSGILPATGL